jgi:alpha-beta hydrolase superfamily lysophospholipase
MNHHEGHFQGEDGMRLFYQGWLPEQAPKAILLIIHGLGEHSGRYSHVVNSLVPEGYVVFTFDQRGHGKSADKPIAHVNSWSEYLSDVKLFLNVVRGQIQGLPLFLIGFSMGGLIALEYALDNPGGLRGVIASGPAVGAVDAPPLLLFIGRILSRILPGFSLETGLNVDGLSRDPAVVRAYVDDPLVTGKATARWSTEFTKAIDRTRARAGGLTLPLLILHGEADTLVPAEGSRNFFEQVTFADKERIVYPGGYHEPHNDIQHEQVVVDLQRWLEAHLGS